MTPRSPRWSGTSGPGHAGHRRSTRDLLVVASVVFVDVLGYTAVLPGLAFRIFELGGTGFSVGLALAGYSMAQIVAAPVLGRCADRWGRRRLLLVSLAGNVASLAVTGLADSVTLLVAARLVAGVCGGSVGVAQAFVVELGEERNRARGVGAVGAATGLAFTLGPGMGALLSGSGFAATVLVSASVAAVNLVVAAVLLPRSASATADPVDPAAAAAGPPSDTRPPGAPPPDARPDAPDTVPDGIGRPPGRPIARRGFRRLLVACAAGTAAFMAMEATLALLVSLRFGQGPALVGGALAAGGVVFVLVQFLPATGLMQRWGERQTGALGAVALAVGVTTLGVGGHPAFVVVGVAVLSGGHGLLTLAVTTALAAGPAATRGARMGAGQSATALARIGGPLAGGALIDLAVPAAFVAAAALAVVALIVLPRQGSWLPPED